MKYIIAAVVVYLTMVLLLGTMCTDYFIYAVSGKDIPFVGDLVLAFFFSGFTIPAALFCWIVEMFGAVTPFFA